MSDDTKAASGGDRSSGTVELPQSILDGAPVGMMLLDRQWMISWANHAAGRIFGADPGALEGRPATSLIHLDDLEKLRSAFEEITTDPSARWEREDCWHTADGRTVWLQMSASAVPRAAGVSMPDRSLEDDVVICQFVDMTARREAEAALAVVGRELQQRNIELERSNQDLTQFAYVASHDLSEPLRVIAGHVELLATRYRGRLDEDADRWIDFAVDGCNRLRALIGDLLKYSRVGRHTTAFEAVDMGAVVTQAAHDLGPALRDSGAQLEVGPLPTISGHSGQLRQLMANLMANAVKFSRPGIVPMIGISAMYERPSWTFRVADNGIGIQEQYRSRVFGIFQRLHAQGHYPGSGIGLAIARRIVELHGGRIWADESGSGGCEIAFTIPDEEARIT